jgi:protein phosphatase
MEDIQGTEQLLVQSLLIIAEQLYDMGRTSPGYEGMGATVVVGLATETTLLIAHLGDSRAYRLREGILERLTQDHNLGNDLRDNEIIQSDADDIPEYQTLCRFIGMENPLPPDIAAFDLKEHDRFLLCSDGLTNMLDDMDISSILMREISCKETCVQLVARANQAGGYDNITVIVADVQYTDSNNEPRDEEAQEMSQMNIYKVPREQQMILEGTSRDRQKG